MRWLTIALGAMVLTAAAPGIGGRPRRRRQGRALRERVTSDGSVQLHEHQEQHRRDGGIDVESHNFTGISLLQNPYATPIAETRREPDDRPVRLPALLWTTPRSPHFTVGGSLVFDFNPGANDSSTAKAAGASMNTTVAAPKITEVGFAPRVGYFMSFNKYLAIWASPRPLDCTRSM